MGLKTQNNTANKTDTQYLSGHAAWPKQSQ